ncbi:hypothetical protein C8A05DRAFT_17123 [Staphylotrichum tortipilum]|uniref:Uncharacterized protein n=1 Tax=Staphylotrichum tortipilum TaxID=2831512 RepID=A0AAN6MGT2_9PEZI|nr:hypothetical protein C8A05DRAFT_17123 [Staphylotrichum longicolle]
MFADDSDIMEYRYWGERLAALQAFMRERPPRNGNAFALALAALLISVVVGVLGRAVAALQTWVACEAWAAPVSNDDDTLATLREIVDLLREQARR